MSLPERVTWDTKTRLWRASVGARGADAAAKIPADHGEMSAGATTAENLSIGRNYTIALKLLTAMTI
jgi:hypothetical protein